MTVALAARPKRRRRDVTTTLTDFAIVTWAIAPAQLARHLPDGSRPTS